MEISKTDFFYIVTIQNDQISYVKHVLAPLYVFFTLFGCWGGGGGLPRGLGHNLLMQFSSLGSSKMEISETDLFDTLTIQKDQISYVKHVLAPLYVFFTLFGCRGGGGGAPQGPGAQPSYVVFLPRQLKNGRSSPLFEVLIVLCGPLKRPMDLWGPMGTYGDPWGPMGTFGDPWEPMGTYGDLWGLMGTCGDLWGPLGTYGGLWGHMGTYGDLWGPVGAYGGLWGPMGAYGGLWGLMGTCGDPWGPLGTYGYLWGPMGTYGDL